MNTALQTALLDFTKSLKGGPGSGNFGHAGRPGEVGGSAPSGEAGIGSESAQNQLKIGSRSGGWEITEAQELATEFRLREGFTYNAITHSEPVTGYVVSMPRELGMERIFSVDDYNAHDDEINFAYLREFREAVASGKISSDIAHIGAWKDETRVVMDVNEVYENRQEAENVGRERKQDGIYDVAKHEVIDLRGKAQKGFHTREDHGQGNRRGTACAGQEDVRGAPPLDHQALKADWDESLHPRDERGRFAESGGADPQTNTPEFRKWFGNSKVVDESGNPLVVYHGTDAKEDFEVFKKASYDVGIHFASPEVAAARLDWKGRPLKVGDPRLTEFHRIIPAYLSIQKPLMLSGDPTMWNPDNLPFYFRAHEPGLFSESQLRVLESYESKVFDAELRAAREAGINLDAIEDKGNEQALANLEKYRDRVESNFTTKVVSMLTAKGYDGIIYPNDNETTSKGIEQSYVVFRPEQIKSAIGNRGTFDPNDPRITKAFDWEPRRDYETVRVAEHHGWYEYHIATAGHSRLFIGPYYYSKGEYLHIFPDGSWEHDVRYGFQQPRGNGASSLDDYLTRLEIHKSICLKAGVWNVSLKDFDESLHPRDDRGRFAEAGASPLSERIQREKQVQFADPKTKERILNENFPWSSVALYHGTTEQAWDKISKEGLTVERMPLSDRNYDKYWYRWPEGRGSSVFLTPDKEIASFYADRVRELRGGKPLVLEVHIPPEGRGRLHRDEMDWSSVRFEGRIEPSWIKRIAVKAAGEVIYLVIVVDGEDALKGGPGSGSWDGPGQPRFAWSGAEAEDAGTEKFSGNASADLDFASSADEVRGILDHYKADEISFADHGSDEKLWTIIDKGQMTVVEWDGKDSYTSVSKAEDFVSSTDPERFYPNFEDDWNKQFWEYPAELYHGTPAENIDSILKDGLNVTVGTGMSNRSTMGVFSSDDYESQLFEYGSPPYGAIIKIDTGAMATDAAAGKFKLPYATREPDVQEADMRNALAHKLGLSNFEYTQESGTGEFPSTVILQGRIPARYLSLGYKWEGKAWVKADWDESLHPRDERGRFAESGGAGAVNPWEMNLADWHDAGGSIEAHKQAIDNAIAAGKIISSRILSDYPDLRDKYFAREEQLQKARDEETGRTLAAGHPEQVTQADFLSYHETGFIPESAYRNYSTLEGVAWLGGKDKYPVLLGHSRAGNETIEYRQTEERLRYVKTDANDEIVRDEQGKATYLSQDEMIAKNLPLTDTTIVAFNEKGQPVGWAANEFGADGIFVTEPYQRQGIGLELLGRFRSQFEAERQMGQMTAAGVELARAYHESLVRDAIREGKRVPEKVLADYPKLQLKALKGGSGSGNFGHAGIIGHQGGSAPSGGPQTDTPAFKKWFGNSKVVDDNGDPLLVHHGTLSAFDQFDMTRAGENMGPFGGTGMAFVGDRAVAETYANPLYRQQALDNQTTAMMTLAVRRPDYENAVELANLTEVKTEHDEDGWYFTQTTYDKYGADSNYYSTDRYDTEQEARDAGEKDKAKDVATAEQRLADYEAKEQAERAALGRDARVVDAYLRIANPKTIDYEGGTVDIASIAAITRDAKASGYDGVIFRNASDTLSGERQTSNIYIPFSADQVKIINSKKSLAALKDFDESLHPRDDHGKFTDAGSGHLDQSALYARHPHDVGRVWVPGRSNGSAKYRLTDSVSTSVRDSEAARVFAEIKQMEGGHIEDEEHYNAMLFISRALAQDQKLTGAERDNWRFVYAVDDQQHIVGSGTMKIDGDKGEIRSVGSTARGAGGRILTELIDGGVRRGLSEIQLTPSIFAKPFYARFGFKPTADPLVWSLDLKKQKPSDLKALYEALKSFDESLHPRDERGRWTDAGAGTNDLSVTELGGGRSRVVGYRGSYVDGSQNFRGVHFGGMSAAKQRVEDIRGSQHEGRPGGEQFEKITAEGRFLGAGKPLNEQNPDVFMMLQGIKPLPAGYDGIIYSNVAEGGTSVWVANESALINRTPFGKKSLAKALIEFELKRK